MTAQDIITRARLACGDSIAPFRSADSDMLLWISDGQRQIFHRRPDALCVSKIVTAPPADVAAVSSTLAIGEDMRTVLVDYVAHRFFEADVEDAANAGLSNRFLEKFIMGLR